MRLSLQRLESPHAFRAQKVVWQQAEFSSRQTRPLGFESPCGAMAVNRYFSDVFCAQNSK
jgi:hypothetical protein